MAGMLPRLLLLPLLLAACSTTRTIYFHPDLRGKAERTVSLDLPEADAFTFVSSYGAIQVRAVAGAPGHAEAKLVLHARTDQEAADALAHFDVSVREYAEREVDVSLAGKPVKLAESGYSVQPRMDLVVTLPPACRVSAETGSGDIEVAGAFRDCNLRSGFGDVVAAGAVGERFSATTGSGRVKLQAVEAAVIEITTSFGVAQLADVKGDLKAVASSGNVVLEGFRGGACSLTSGYGDIEAEGVFSRLEAMTSSGDVSVRAAPESRVDPEWRLESSFGDVALALPPDVGCRIQAETSFGAVRCDVALDGMETSERQVGGSHAGGGGPVTLVTRSGDVRIRRA